eukprot:4580082-Pyramimonas_sp.AAC.1
MFYKSPPLLSHRVPGVHFLSPPPASGCCSGQLPRRGAYFAWRALPLLSFVPPGLSHAAGVPANTAVGWCSDSLNSRQGSQWE